MDLNDYPLLNEPNVMLVCLKVAKDGPALPAQCEQRLLDGLRHAGVVPPDDLGPLRRRIETAFRYLCVAGLLDPDDEGRCAITRRGHEMLIEHPTGIDSSVLVAFPEFQSYIEYRSAERQRQTEDSGTVEPKASYDAGYQAFREGSGLTDNPFPNDTVNHLEWENGWCEAREEREAPRKRVYDPNRGGYRPD